MIANNHEAAIRENGQKGTRFLLFSVSNDRLTFSRALLYSLIWITGLWLRIQVDFNQLN